jgi:hypothetical protein
MGFVILGLWFGVPVLLCVKMCQDKNRSVGKGVFVGLIGGWIAVVCCWLFLKTRVVRPDGTVSFA